MYMEQVTNSTYLPGGGQGYHRDCDTHVSWEGLASQRAGCLPQRGCKHFPESRQKFQGDRATVALGSVSKLLMTLCQAGGEAGWGTPSWDHVRQALFTLPTPHCPGGGNLMTAHSPPTLFTLPLPFPPSLCLFLPLPAIFLHHTK